MDSREFEDSFTDIYRANYWGGGVSRSGKGSDPEQTRVIVAAMEDFILRRGIRSVVDLGCGDVSWQETLMMALEDYTGVDVVGELIERNRRVFAAYSPTFVQADITRYPLAFTNMILCRDVLCHLPYEDALRLIKNVKNSGAYYFVSTTFPRHYNPVMAPGPMAWYAINLTEAPFLLPEPCELLVEDCPDAGFEDKALGVWRVAEM
jgi:SAM-dependent methyltransferase